MEFSWLKNKSSQALTKVKNMLPYQRSSENGNGNGKIIKKYDSNLVFSLSQTRIPRLKQLKYIFRFFSNKEKLETKIVAGVCIISLLLFSFSFVWRHTEAAPTKGGSYTEATIGVPQYINPILASSNDIDVDLTKLVYSGLLKYNQRLELEPDMAENFQISSDQKIYTFKLKSSLKWHDGEKITAEDIAFTIETIQNPLYASPLEPSFRGVIVKQLDDLTVQFILNKPFAPFLHSLNIGIIPKHIWETIPAQNFKLAELNLKPIGSGMWKFDSLKKDKEGNLISYSLKPFSDFYGTKPYLKHFNFKFYSSPEAATQSLLDKNVDGLSFLSKEKKQILNKKDISIYNLHLPQYTAIFINQNKNEFLQDKNIRLALATSISKQKIVLDIFHGEADVIEGPLLPGLPGFDASFKPYNFDKNESIKILEEAGWKLITEQTYRQKNEKILEVTLTTVDTEENIKTSELIKNFWENIGIKVNLNIAPVSNIQKRIIKPRNYEMLLFGEILGSDPDLFPFWHSSQNKNPGLNLTDFSNKKADALLEQARQTIDINERTTKYKEFQEIISENIPAIFLFQPTYSYPLSKKLKGFELNRINITSDRLLGNEKWHTKTRRRWK